MRPIMRFIDRTALVTGGGSGLGEAIAHRLAAEGAHVVIADVDSRAASNVADAVRSAGGSATGHHVDVRDEQSISRLRGHLSAEVDGLNVLVNNAGIVRRASVEEFSDGDWASQMEVNLLGAALMTQAFLPLLRAARGSVVNITSEGAFRPRSEHWIYDASKAGLGALTRATATELVQHGVRANAVAPGWMVTEMHFRSAPDPEQRKQELEALDNPQCLMRRLGRPHEIAAAVAFLASDDASYITGTTMHVDGGMGLG
jgi:NAD(P)-dependent dehydrogenase (short-subunit alcohol dehydrogenase family)